VNKRKNREKKCWTGIKYIMQNALYKSNILKCIIKSGNTPPSHQNLSEGLYLLGLERGGVFKNTPPTLHQHPT